MKKPVTTILLIILLAGCVAGALTLHSWTEDLRTYNQSRVDAAQARLDAQTATYAHIDPNTDEGAQVQQETENAAIADAQEQTVRLEEANAALEEEIEGLQRRVEELEAEEETAYYLAIYDQMAQGIEEVQGYIEGN